MWKKMSSVRYNIAARSELKRSGEKTERDEERKKKSVATDLTLIKINDQTNEKLTLELDLVQNVFHVGFSIDLLLLLLFFSF